LEVRNALHYLRGLKMSELRMLDNDSPIVKRVEKTIGNTNDYEYALLKDDKWDEHREQYEADDWRGIGTVLSAGSILLERRKR
jgi:hypothetical protein